MAPKFEFFTKTRSKETPIAEPETAQVAVPPVAEATYMNLTAEEKDILELDTYADAEKQSIKSWLERKVRSELVDQMYSSVSVDTGSIDIDKVAVVLAKELEVRKAQSQDLVDDIMMQIPYIELKKAPSSSVTDFTYRDIAKLQRVSEVHSQVIDYIDDLQTDGDDKMQDLAVRYIATTEADARKDVVKILKSQKQELEQELKLEKMDNQQRIAQLLGAIGILEATNKETQSQLVDRDLQLLDSEFENHLSTSLQNNDQ